MRECCRKWIDSSLPTTLHFVDLSLSYTYKNLFCTQNIVETSLNSIWWNRPNLIIVSQVPNYLYSIFQTNLKINFYWKGVCHGYIIFFNDFDCWWWIYFYHAFVFFSDFEFWFIGRRVKEHDLCNTPTLLCSEKKCPYSQSHLQIHLWNDKNLDGTPNIRIRT